MDEEKISVAKKVREIIECRPALKECLILGVINYSALARAIQEEFEKKNIIASTEAVKMALIRLSDELKKERSSMEKRVRKVLARTIIQLQSDLSVITIEKNTFLKMLGKLLQIVEKSRFFQISQGVDTFTLVIPGEDRDRILDLFSSDGIVDIIDGQTVILLISPIDIISVPGVIGFITSILSFYGINVTQIISCHKDTLFVVNRNEAPRAYSILQDIILRMRMS